MFCALITRAKSILEERRRMFGDISGSCTRAAIETATTLHYVKDGVRSRTLHADLVAPINQASDSAKKALDASNCRIMRYRIARWGCHVALFLLFVFIPIALVRWLKDTAIVGYLNPEEFVVALVPTFIRISSP